MTSFASNSNSNSNENHFSYDVLVIGGGLSGLAAARHLLRNQNQKEDKRKLRIGVLEARDRVGGRTLSTKVSNSTVAWVADK